MARYGVDYYGRAYYGNIALADYDAAPFNATAIDYGKIHVTWATPAGNWTGIRLLRNSYGFPQTADDGTVLVDQTRGNIAAATPVDFYDPVGVGQSVAPRTDNEVHNKKREIVNWSAAGGILKIEIVDGSYLVAGTSVSVFGGTSVDGTYIINNISLTQPTLTRPVIFPQTYTVEVLYGGTSGSGTGGYLLINQLEQEHFYYYSIFVKTLSNPVYVTGAVSNGDGTVTYTTAGAHTFLVGDLVGVNGMSPITYNISGYQVIARTTNTFTIVSGATGTATVSPNSVAGLNTQWVRAGNAVGISVKDYGTQALMYNYLPDIYKVVDTTQSIENQENPTLRSFLALFGFYYDLLKTYATLAATRYDMKHVAGQLLPAALQEFKFIYEPELGFKRMRSLLANATHIYQSKGSLLGTKDYIKAFTGLESTIVQGKNLMLDNDTSSFELGKGNWTATNATITPSVGAYIDTWVTTGTTLTLTLKYPSTSPYTFTNGNAVRIQGSTGLDNIYSSSVTVSSTTNALYGVTTTTISMPSNAAASTGSGGYVYPYSFLPYLEGSNPAQIDNARLGVGKITCTSAGTITARCANSAAPLTTGIPISASTNYTFSVKMLSASTTRSVTLYIDWYDYRGNLLSTVTGTPFTTSNANWSTISVSGLSNPLAYFAIGRLSIASAALTEVHYIDAVQFEEGSSATYYQDARQLQIYVHADRVNELINPNFDFGSTAPWSITNATIEVAVGEVVGTGSTNIANSANSGEVYSSGTSDVEIRSCAVADTANYISVLAGNAYTYSSYWIMSADNNPTVNQNITMKIDWYDKDKVFLGTSSSGTWIVPLNATVSFSRAFVTATAPESAAYAIARTTWSSPTASGYGLIFDEAMFEKSSFVLEYFDGSYGYADQNDLRWQGTPGSSRSHYYRNRNATYGRLKSTLSDYLLAGTNYAIYYAAL